MACPTKQPQLKHSSLEEDISPEGRVSPDKTVPPVSTLVKERAAPPDQPLPSESFKVKVEHTPSSSLEEEELLERSSPPPSYIIVKLVTREPGFGE